MLLPDHSTAALQRTYEKQLDSEAASAGSQRASESPLIRATKTGGKSQHEQKGTSRFRVPFALKIAAYFMLPVLIGLSTLTYVMTDSHREFQLQQINQFGDLFSQQLASSATEPLFADATLELNVLVNQILDNQFILGAALFDHEHNLLASSGLLPKDINFGQRRVLHNQALLYQAHPSLDDLSASSFQTIDKVSQAQTDSTSIDSNVPVLRDIALFIQPVSFRNTLGGYAAVVFENSQVTGNFEKLSQLLLGSTILLVLSSTLIIFAITRRMLQPLSSIAEAVKGMGKGDNTYIPERRNDELGQLIQSINNMGKDLAKKSQVESVLGKFLAADVAHKVIDELDTVNFKGEHVEASVLFADIVGFTEMAENMPPSEVSALLNEFFAHYSSCAKYYFGTVDKYIGDCVMIVFGVNRQDEHHQYHALACAQLMQKLTTRINQNREAAGQFPVHLRIGINSGEMLAGLLGSQDRMEYTVVGDAVNLASRLCNEANSGQIIVQEDCYQAVSAQHRIDVDNVKKIKIRGKSEPVSIYNITKVHHRRTGVDDALITDLLEKPGINKNA